MAVFYLMTVNLFDVPAPFSSIARIMCSPIGTSYVNVSPDLVVPIVLSSINQNIFAVGVSLIALNETVAMLRSSVITMRVVSAGDVMIIGFSFSVILFTDYYEEARKIKGQHQSMELDPLTIDGDWAEFNGEPYFVYTKGNMLGLCVIGAHEPCFSVSSFFAKNDDTYKTQYEKFSSLLSGLKEKIEEAEINKKGGEQQMDGTENELVVNPTPEVVEPEV